MRKPIYEMPEKITERKIYLSSGLNREVWQEFISTNYTSKTAITTMGTFGESNGELTIKKTDNVVNAPMIVWKSNGVKQKASMIQNMFESMPEVDGEITNIDVENYLVMMKLHSKNSMSMMGMNP